MKKLFLIRHAKSSWDDATLKDFDRPLNKRGEQNAPLMAKRLKTKQITPDIIYASPAERAKSTALIFDTLLNPSSKIQWIPTLYESSKEIIITLIKNTPKEAKTIFIVGHNPELGELAQFLVGFNENLPTAGILEIEVHTQNWKDISANNCLLLDFDYPKKPN